MKQKDAILLQYVNEAINQEVRKEVRKKPKTRRGGAKKSQTPKSQTPKSQTPKSQTPKSQTPKSQTPKSQTPKSQTPKSQTQKSKQLRFRRYQYIIIVGVISIIALGGGTIVVKHFIEKHPEAFKNLPKTLYNIPMQFLNALKKYSDSIFKETAGQESSGPAADAEPAGQESTESTVFALGKSLAVTLSKKAEEAGKMVAEAPKKANEMAVSEKEKAKVKWMFENALHVALHVGSTVFKEGTKIVKEGTKIVNEMFTGIPPPPVDGFEEILKWNKEEILGKLDLKEKDYKKDETLKQLVEWVQKHHPKKANVQPSWIHKLYIKDGKIEECGKFWLGTLEQYYDKNYKNHCLAFKPEVK